MNDEVRRVRRKQSRIIADEFRRLGHTIDTHEVFGTHSPPIEYYETSLGLTLKRRRWAETISELVRYV